MHLIKNVLATTTFYNHTHILYSTVLIFWVTMNWLVQDKPTLIEHKIAVNYTLSL